MTDETRKLYAVRTVAPEFKRHRDVTINWFVDKRATRVQRPYAELITGYDCAENDPYPEGAIDELFSAAEAAAFVGWLKLNRDATDENTTVDEVVLPISRDTMGLGAIAVGGAQDFLVMAEVSGKPAASPLGFTVLGYYDLRHYEPIDKSVPARHQFSSMYIIGGSVIGGRGGRVVTDYAELLELWRAGEIMADDEFPHIESTPF